MIIPAIMLHRNARFTSTKRPSARPPASKGGSQVGLTGWRLLELSADSMLHRQAALISATYTHPHHGREQDWWQVWWYLLHCMTFRVHIRKCNGLFSVSIFHLLSRSQIVMHVLPATTFGPASQSVYPQCSRSLSIHGRFF